MARYNQEDSIGVFEWRNLRREGSNSDRENGERQYYPIYGDMSLCFSNETIKGAYYLDINENPYTWKQCYEKCKTCNTHGNETNMNCLSCETNLNNNFELVEGNCKIICGNNTFITPDEDCVSTCPNGTYQYSFNNSCLYSCPNNYEINKNNK